MMVRQALEEPKRYRGVARQTVSKVYMQFAGFKSDARLINCRIPVEKRKELQSESLKSHRNIYHIWMNLWLYRDSRNILCEFPAGLLKRLRRWSKLSTLEKIFESNSGNELSEKEIPGIYPCRIPCRAIEIEIEIENNSSAGKKISEK